ncbi:hypothetical protein [Devosia sp.]|jgi:precorrin-8X/cobalt-precorrin-8 methylmutase|uniref:hypothetical protein n=1 Tax=Devosia sp. TaxID=1871048 RepID=UPI0037C09E4B
MPIFDRYIAVDWSANNGPKTGKDSIWIAERGPKGDAPSLNPRTRSTAVAHIMERLDAAVEAGQRTFVGFDFPFGYPLGAASRIAGDANWSALWAAIDQEIVDDDRNRSNRFLVASMFNARLGQNGPRFWGCPASARTDQLSTHKIGACFSDVAEFRTVERVARGAKSTWQLFYNGSVGSQCLLGLPQVQRLRSRFAGKVAIWPFETDFERSIDASIVIGEIYPSLDSYDQSVLPKDRAQMEAQVRRFSALDDAGLFGKALSLPDDFFDQRASLLAEEGWIVGAGHKGLSA